MKDHAVVERLGSFSNVGHALSTVSNKICIRPVLECQWHGGDRRGTFAEWSVSKKLVVGF
jgi:hypothetical protein